MHESRRSKAASHEASSPKRSGSRRPRSQMTRSQLAQTPRLSGRERNRVSLAGVRDRIQVPSRRRMRAKSEFRNRPQRETCLQLPRTRCSFRGARRRRSPGEKAASRWRMRAQCLSPAVSDENSDRGRESVEEEVTRSDALFRCPLRERERCLLPTSGREPSSCLGSGL